MLSCLSLLDSQLLYEHLKSFRTLAYCQNGLEKLPYSYGNWKARLADPVASKRLTSLCGHPAVLMPSIVPHQGVEVLAAV